MEWSTADLDFRDQNLASKIDRYSAGYQAGVIRSLSAVVAFYESEGSSVPYGLRDVILDLVETTI